MREVGRIDAAHLFPELDSELIPLLRGLSAEDWARTQGCREMASDALVDNEVSRLAHLGVGYAEVEVIRCFRKSL